MNLKPKYTHMIKYQRNISLWIMRAFREHWKAKDCSHCGTPHRQIAGQGVAMGPRYDEQYSKSQVIVFYTCHTCQLRDDDIFIWPQECEIVYNYWLTHTNIHQPQLLKEIFILSEDK